MTSETFINPQDDHAISESTQFNVYADLSLPCFLPLGYAASFNLASQTTIRVMRGHKSLDTKQNAQK